MTTAEALAKLRGCLDGEIHWEGVGPKPWWEPLALIEKEMERLRMMQAHALRADEWQDRAEKAEADCEEYLRRILGWQDRAEKAEAERDEARRRFSLEELERLERRVAELEAALREIAETDALFGGGAMQIIARRALGGGEA